LTRVGAPTVLPFLVWSLVLAGLAPMAQADLLSDAQAIFETRNVYFNRDFKDGPSTLQSNRAEWAQGAMLKIESGICFTLGAFAERYRAF
jgi:hypothetical protein